MNDMNLKQISSTELKKLLEQEKTDLCLIDVRTPEEYSRGHLKGSQNIPLDILLEQDPHISKDRPLVVYCLSGSRSILAATALISMQYKQVMNLQKGLLEWRFLKYPETT